MSSCMALTNKAIKRIEKTLYVSKVRLPMLEKTFFKDYHFRLTDITCTPHLMSPSILSQD